MKSATKAIACKPDHSQVASAAPADKVNNFLNLARQKQKKQKEAGSYPFKVKMLLLLIGPTIYFVYSTLGIEVI